MKTTAALALVLGVAAFLRLWGWDYGLPHPKGRPDEELVVEAVFQMYGRGELAPITLAYPTLPIYLNAAVFALYFELGDYERKFDLLFDMVVLRPGLHFRICRAVSLAAGLLTVLATFFVGVVGYARRDVGLLASLFVATSLLLVIYSRFATVDIIVTFFVTLALVFGVKAARDAKWSSFALGGLFVGLATASKYNALLVSLSLAVPALSTLATSKERPRPWSLLGKLVVAGAIAFLAFALTSTYSLLRLPEILAFLSRLNDALYAAPDEAAFWVHGRDTFPHGLGWPVYLASLAGVVRFAWLRRPSDLALLGFALPFFLSIAGVRLVHPRYVLPLVPVMAVMAAELVCALIPKARFRAPAYALAVALALPGLFSSIAFDRVAAERDTRVLAAEWVAENLPKRSKIAVCAGYGAPKINTDRRRPPAFEPVEVRCSAPAVTASGAPYVVTYAYPPWHQAPGPALAELLEERGELLKRFDPFHTRDYDELLFYRRDAFYLPLAGFEVLERGGPIVTIWRLEP